MSPPCEDCDSLFFRLCIVDIVLTRSAAGAAILIIIRFDTNLCPCMISLWFQNLGKIDLMNSQADGASFAQTSKCIQNFSFGWSDDGSGSISIVDFHPVRRVPLSSAEVFVLNTACHMP